MTAPDVSGLLVKEKEDAVFHISVARHKLEGKKRGGT
jgi:hypothetical protein